MVISMNIGATHPCTKDKKVFGPAVQPVAKTLPPFLFDATPVCALQHPAAAAAAASLAQALS